MATITMSREELNEYKTLTTKRKELDRESRTLKSRCDQIEAKALAQLKAAGKQSAKRFGFVLAIIAGRASVAWKEAFIKECGPEKATALQEGATATEKCAITPPADE